MKRLRCSRLVYAYRSRNCKRRLTVSPTAAPTAVLPSRGRDKKRFMVPEPSAEEGSLVGRGDPRAGGYLYNTAWRGNIRIDFPEDEKWAMAYMAFPGSPGLWRSYNGSLLR